MNPRLLTALVACSALTGQTALEVKAPNRELSPYVLERLGAADRVLFEKLVRAPLEAMWSDLVAKGYEHCFIHELDALHPNRRLVGRARTIRYLPTRPDLRDQIYSRQKQLNYVSAEEAQPGDVLVFDAGGDTRSAVSGEITTIRFLARGGTGLIVDGALRDVPEIAGMPLQVYQRRGQAAAVRPNLMSIDYQVPVRIGNVTVQPGDLLVGERHGILVIPAALAEEVVQAALSKEDLESFQRKLLLDGRSIYGVYPPDDETRREYEASRPSEDRK
ncbi:MAG: hypothetical protein OXC19_19525 [Bryobacterales bacterium]|nr:hypothetical protein [Bryobacterales bacterium]